MKNIKEIQNELKQIKESSITILNINGHIGETQVPKSNEAYNVKCSVLFVDIRHSTDMTDVNGRKNMIKIYKMFAKLVINVIEGYDGYVEQIMGDGMLCTFYDTKGNPSGNKAVNAAIKINEYISEAYNPIVEENCEISCGVGICTGHVYITKIGNKGLKKCSQVAYPSSITNYACKLCGQAKENEILFDDKTSQEIKDKDIRDTVKKKKKLGIQIYGIMGE